MYVPRAFQETDTRVLHDFIRAHPLATLVSQSNEGLCADHLPLLSFPEDDGTLTLRGHVARGNPVWRRIEAHSSVLVVFLNAGSYITPSWYATKARTGEVVPTWNYAAVHAYGDARIAHDGTWLRSFLAELTDHHEAQRSTPWRLSDAPDDYIDARMKVVVGIEVRVTRLEGKWKMSQNRAPEDIDSVVAGLRAEGDAPSTEMAEQVERCRPS